MMLTAVELFVLSPADRPQALSEVIGALTGAWAEAPSGVEPILAIEADGTLRVVYYREVTPQEKLTTFLTANPDVQAIVPAMLGGKAEEVSDVKSAGQS